MAQAQGTSAFTMQAAASSSVALRPSVTSSLPPPACVAGRYEVVEPIEEGGGSFVLLADDRRTRRRVAIKLLKPSLAGVDCSCGQGCECQPGEPGCVCQSFEFFHCKAL